MRMRRSPLAILVTDSPALLSRVGSCIAGMKNEFPPIDMPVEGISAVKI
jgi:hypothetical protein